MRRFGRHILQLLAIAVLGACENIDCTLNNVVLCHISFYDKTTEKPIQLTDTISVVAVGIDSVLFNKGYNISSLQVPLSYWKDADTLRFVVNTEDDTFESQVIIQKSNTIHYESPDCPMNVFHQIVSATATGSVIDSIAVSRREVNYLQDENIQIFIRTATE